MYVHQSLTHDANAKRHQLIFAPPPVAKVATKMKTAFALVAALAVSADAFAPASSSSFVGRSRSFAANDSALSMAMERTYIMVRPALIIGTLCSLACLVERR